MFGSVDLGPARRGLATPRRRLALPAGAETRGSRISATYRTVDPPGPPRTRDRRRARRQVGHAWFGPARVAACHAYRERGGQTPRRRLRLPAHDSGVGRVVAAADRRTECHHALTAGLPMRLRATARRSTVRAISSAPLAKSSASP